MRTSRLAAVGVYAAALAALAGCAVLEPNTPELPPSELELCAQGQTWNVDVAGLATQVLAILQANGVAATEVQGAGTETFTWSEIGDVVIDSDYSLTILVPAADGQVLTVSQTISGTSTGKAYINGTVAIPRNWDGTELEIVAKADLAGVVQESVPFAIPQTTFDDKVGIELKCTGTSMMTNPRGEPISQSWTRAG
ncbi:MAG: hypothetical protein LH471_02365 [Salinibacterium sp.]|nr:hypothetical protein [Salinibacterium sp.]